MKKKSKFIILAILLIMVLIGAGGFAYLLYAPPAKEIKVTNEAPLVEKEVLLKRNTLPNVILITLDTVRQDHLSVYGHKRETTPVLNELVKTSRMYNNAYSTSGWTGAAHASLFTGLYSIAHKTTQENWAMSDQLVTLAEVFAQQGYQTTAIVENAVLNHKNNYDQGFTTYFEVWQDFSNKVKRKLPLNTNNLTFDLFEQTVTNKNPSQPFFMFVNFIDPHSPYDTSRHLRNTFVSDASVDSGLENQWTQFYLGNTTFTNAQLNKLKELYDAEILYVDTIIGQMIDVLKQEQLWENTVFVITSDHGENIGDHEMMDHVFSLYESTIKIPLIIHYPKLFTPGSKDSSMAQLADIFPTLMNIIEVNSSTYKLQGEDLLNEKRISKGTAFIEYYYPKQAFGAFDKEDQASTKLDKYKRRIRSVIANNRKFIWGSDNAHELYDLSKDPLESNNLIGTNAFAQTEVEMAALLNTLVTQYTEHEYVTSDEALPEPDKDLDKKTLDKLRSLGYIE